MCVEIMRILLKIFYCSLFLCLLLVSGSFSAQKSPKALIDGKVSSTAGKKLGGATMVIKKNGTVVNTVTTSSNGKYPTIELPMGQNYTITVSLDGYVGKEIAIDAKTGYFEEDSPDVIPMDIPFELNEMQPDVDYSSITNGFQIGKLKIDPATNGLAIDQGFTSSQGSKYAKFFKDLEAKADADEAKFNKLVADGDKATSNGDFSGALSSYNQALDLKSADPAVTAKVTETKQKIEIKKNFDQAVSDGDQNLASNSFDQAIAKYQAAKAIMPSDKTIDAKIKEAETKKAAAAGAEIDKQYSAKMVEAKKAFDSKDYAFAKTLYGEAGTIKPSEKDPPAKIAEIDKIIKDELEKDKQYNELVAAGNKGLLDETYDIAIAKYEAALKIRKESSVETDLAKAKSLKQKQEANAAKKVEFDKLIAAGDSKLGSKDFDAAIAEYQKALDMGVDDPQANAKITSAKIAKKEANDAAAADAAAAKKKEFDQLIAAGATKESGKDFDAAIVEYQKALDLNVDNPTANAKIQGAKDAKKAEEEAKLAKEAAAKKAEFDKFITAGTTKQGSKDFDGAIAEYQKALDLNVDNPTANAKIQGAKDAKKAAEDEANAAALAAENKAKFDAFIAAGTTKQTSKEFDAAISEYQKALDLNVDNPTANAKIQGAKDAKKAAEDAKLADEAAAKKAEFDKFISAGTSKQGSKDFDAAIAEFQKALDLNVDNPTANAKIQGAKDAKKAAEDEANAAALAAEKKAKFDAFITAGTGKLSSKDFDGAIADYQSALVLDVDNPTANTKIQAAKDAKAAYEAKMGEEAAAKLAAEKKAKFDAFITAGTGKLTGKDYDGAIAEYQSALALDVDNPTANTKIQAAKDAKAAFEAAKSSSDAEAKKNADFNKFIAEGDAAKNNKEWEKAKSLYGEANKVKPTDPLPQQKIDEVERLMKLQLLSEQDELFNKIMTKAKELTAAEEYDKAIGLYEKAKTNFPGKTEPDEEIAKINNIIANKAAKEAEYLKHLNAADGKFESGQWQAAREDYVKAKSVFDRTRPNEQIAIIDKKIEEEKNKGKEAAELAAKKARYDALMIKAKGEKDASSYDQAIATYKQAKTEMPSESEPQIRIDEINAILKDKAGNEALMAKYNAAIQKANAKRDQAYAARDENLVDDAKNLYSEANKIKSDESYPQEQVDELNKFLDKIRVDKENEAYQKIIDKADELFAAKTWDGAEKLYKRAITFKASDPYPPAQLKKIKEARANAGKNNDFQDLIAKADGMFDAADYYNSKSTYEAAKALKPTAVYPKQRIDEINALLEKQKQDAKDKLDQGKPIASTKPDYGEKVSGMSELEMQQLLEQGKLSEIEGNDAVIEARKVDRLAFDDLEKDVQLSRTEAGKSDLIGLETKRSLQEEVWDDQRENAIPKLEDYKESELVKVADYANVEEARSYQVDRFNDAAELERFKAQNDMDVQRTDNIVSMEGVKENEINKLKDFKDVEEERSYKVDRYNEASETERYKEDNRKDVQRQNNIVDMEGVKERELAKTENFTETNRDVTYDNHIATADLTAKFETFSKNSDLRRSEETVKQMEDYKFKQEKNTQTDREFYVNKTDDINEYNTEMSAKFETFSKDSDKPREENAAAVHLYQEKYLTEKTKEVNKFTDKSQNTYAEREKVKEDQFNLSTDEDIMRTRNVDDMEEYKELKLKGDEALTGKYTDGEYDKSQQYNEVKNQKATMFSDENVDPLIGQYKEGITEEMYQRKNNMGEVIEVTILRVVVTGNKADEYKKVTTRWNTNYFKNGGVITQHIWDTETH